MNRITNTTVISNFASVGRLDLLHDIVAANEHLYVPIEVYDEITAGQREGYTFYDAIEQHIAPFATAGWLHLVTMTEQELTLFVTLPPQLHRGEGACLCIARQRHWGFLTDDRAARHQALAWGIPTSGTLGILLLATRDGRLSLESANTTLKSMIDRANYRSPVNDLGSLLK